MVRALPWPTWTLNLRQGVTELSREIYGLHMLILWVCVAIAVAVFGVMIYSIATFRKSKGAVPASFDHNTNAEVIWTLIPVVILVAMAIPAARTLVKIEDATRLRTHDQGHRLPVEVAVRLRRSRRELLLDARPHQ